MMDFTNDELNLLCIYQRDTRKELIAALTEMRGYLDADEAELRDTKSLRSWSSSLTLSRTQTNKDRSDNGSSLTAAPVDAV